MGEPMNTKLAGCRDCGHFCAAQDLPAEQSLPETARAILRSRPEPHVIQRRAWMTPTNLPTAHAEGLPGHRPTWLPLRYEPRAIPPALSASALRELSLRAQAPHFLAQLSTFRLADMTYPWNTIGRVFVGQAPDFVNWTESGTGVLVGKNLILTASHICPWDVANPWMRFVPNYLDGTEPYGHA